MKEREKIEIAVAGDSNYIVPITVLLKSIFVHNAGLHITVNFLHLSNQVSQEELQQMEDFIVSHGHEMRRLKVTDEQLGEVPQSRHSKSAFLRLVLPHLLPEQVDKVLYLDGDIVVNGSIRSLYNLDITGVYIAGAKDTINIFGKEHCRKLGLPDDYAYFNSGVALMNIKRIREENLQEKFFEFTRQHMDVINSPDQDVLNATLHRAVSYFPPLYNYNYWTEKDIALRLFTKEEVEAALRRPVIIHYIGPVKPWHYKSIHPKKALWWHYLKQTPYKGYRPKDKNLKNIIAYFFLRTFVKPVKPLLTVRAKQKIGRLLPGNIKRAVKKALFKAQ
ncbi:MAG: glycosyltransferase family 8 protein [Mediterranea sp.]|jgi:lipopolysaccharide biosynthesis glycosyltransferase|nr:glycosyltransferase family 8 protein [Mediterranea sp.]